MKSSHSKLLAAAALAAGLALESLALAPAAHAFTFENGTGSSTGGDASAMRFGTGDSRFSTGNGTGTTNSSSGRASFGSGSLQFSSQPGFNQRYNADRMFDSNNILGKDR